MSSSMKAAIHLGPIFFGELGSLQEQELRKYCKFIQYYSQVDNGTF